MVIFDPLFEAHPHFYNVFSLRKPKLHRNFGRTLHWLFYGSYCPKQSGECSEKHGVCYWKTIFKNLWYLKFYLNINVLFCCAFFISFLAFTFLLKSSTCTPFRLGGLDFKIVYFKSYLYTSLNGIITSNLESS